MFQGIYSTSAILRPVAVIRLSGNAWPLVEGTGHQYGLWVITRIEEISSHFFRDGAAEKIEFNLTLEHVDDERTDLIGHLALPTVARLAGGYV